MKIVNGGNHALQKSNSFVSLDLCDCVCVCVCYFNKVLQPPVGQDILIIKHSWTHSDTPPSIGLLWASDQPYSGTSTWQHTTLTKDIHPYPSGIRTHNPSKREAAEVRLRLRGNWDRHDCRFSALKIPVKVLHISRTCVLLGNFLSRRRILRHGQNISDVLGFLILGDIRCPWALRRYIVIVIAIYLIFHKISTDIESVSVQHTAKYRKYLNEWPIYEGHLESKERFAIQRYLLIIGKKKNTQVLWHTFTYLFT